MVTVEELALFLDAFAPLRLAESWDNVGLLVGDRHRSVERLMTCLTITDDTAKEAIDERADLIVVHHPLPFAPLKRLTTDTPSGRLLWSLAGAHISIFSPHTAFDSGPEGINQRLAIALGLSDIEPITPHAEDIEGVRLGAGRCGRLAEPIALGKLANRVKEFLQIEAVQLVGESDTHVTRIGVGCGSAGELLGEARRMECDCFVTGEVRFHTAIEAEALGLSLIVAGHYATERFGIEYLADLLAVEFPKVHVWASRAERDPLSWI